MYEFEKLLNIKKMVVMRLLSSWFSLGYTTDICKVAVPA